MNRFQLTMAAVIASLATAVAAQQGPGPGDLIPRSGTIAYMTSDHPDTLYRLFGRDTKGGWKLKSFARGMMEKEHTEDPDSEEARRDKQIFDYIFGSYEAVERVEIGLVDVTLDGPKYLVHLKTREGATISPQPEFLKEFLEETKEFAGVKYHLYRVPNDEPDMPDDSGDGETAPDERGEEPRNALGDSMYGMDRYYIASTPKGLLIANFETTIREALTRLSTGDYSDALSGREEFAEWVNTRKPHDFSVFIIGREIQNAVERLLPSKEQAGVDAEGIYRGVDKWLQFREYKYIVFDLDYDDAARGITVAAAFKTRRPTRLLEKLAIEPAEFKLLKYVPDGAILTAGLQIGDAKQTFENLRELGYDVEDWADEINTAMRGGSTDPDTPPMPPDDGDIEPKSFGPFDILKSLQDMEGESEPGSNGNEETRESEIDKALKELDEMLAEYGTSRDAVLGVLGTEGVVFALPNIERARAMSSGRVGFDDLFGTSDLGVAIGIKDVAKAKAILATAREHDKEGAFRGFADVGYQGRTFSVSPEQPYGWCFTDDALLIVVAMGVYEEDATAPVIAGLKAMTDSASRTVTGGTSFLKEGSKFIELDFGSISRITTRLNEDLSKRLDRYSRPPLDGNPVDAATDLTFALRLKEYKDGVELAVRIAGLPDFGQFLDGELSPFNNGGNAKRNAYNYTEDNLRTLSGALHRRVDSGEAPDLDAMLKLEDIRKGVLQVPFDGRWQGDIGLIGWTTLDQVVRDSEGNLPDWVESEAAAMIEKNEQQEFRSIVLAEGDIKTWLENWDSGYIVAYQEMPDTLGGHVVLYADGVTGWLAGEVLQQALDLNAKGEPVPAEDRWAGKSSGRDEPRKGPPPGRGPRIREDDPWFPGPSKD